MYDAIHVKCPDQSNLRVCVCVCVCSTKETSGHLSLGHRRKDSERGVTISEAEGPPGDADDVLKQMVVAAAQRCDTTSTPAPFALCPLPGGFHGSK